MYAGGGGGGTRVTSGGTGGVGGTGGGGQGGTAAQAGFPGTANTGGGGGGGGYGAGDYQGPGGQGGSGIVIVRYPLAKGYQQRPGASAYFDGSDDYVRFGNGTALQLTTAVTLSAWVYQREYGTYNVIIAKHIASTGNRHFMLGIVTAGQIFMAVAGTTFQSTNTVTQLATWYHVVGVYNGVAGTMDLYLNGVADMPTKNSGVPATMPSSDVEVVVSGYGYPSVVEKFKGSIADVRIYGRALSQAEITRLYESSCSPRIIMSGE
jgi:hypothetical protein